MTKHVKVRYFGSRGLAWSGRLGPLSAGVAGPAPAALGAGFSLSGRWAWVWLGWFTLMVDLGARS